MNPDLIAPEGMQCRDTGHVAGSDYRCRLIAGHDGYHADQPGPGETVTWARATDPVGNGRCADVFTQCETVALHCTLERDHGGDHHRWHYAWPDSHRWLSVSTDPEPGGVPVCDDTGPNEAGPSFTCQRPEGHVGDHEETFSGGKGYSWPQVGSVRCNDKPGVVQDGEEFDCALAEGYAGDHESNPGFSDNSRWPSPPWHQELADAMAAANSYVAREYRDRGTELAVQALMPVAGAFNFIPGPGTGRADYGDAIIGLADQLGGYIQNGRS